MYKYILLLLVSLVLTGCSSLEIEEGESKEVVSFEIKEDVVLFETEDIYTSVEINKLLFEEGESFEIRQATLTTNAMVATLYDNCYIVTIPESEIKTFSQDYANVTKSNMKFIEFNKDKTDYEVLEK